ncbi:hypothetical protein GCM10010319_68940 [Streptomyces blastmyceticus]|uniref:Uncharacterized protein n=1 Tax=Streptomyces blastmyceticus TaxID=68180 RepID=A0ABN0Y290_9ACTN
MNIQNSGRSARPLNIVYFLSTSTYQCTCAPNNHSGPRPRGWGLKPKVGGPRGAVNRCPEAADGRPGRTSGLRRTAACVPLTDYRIPVDEWRLRTTPSRE